LKKFGSRSVGSIWAEPGLLPIIAERIAKGVDPLGPDNKLIFARDR